MVNPLLDQIKNSEAEKDNVEDDTTSNVTTEVATDVEFAPAKGETMFEPESEDVLIRTAFPDGREIGFPYITSDKADLKFLHEFAEHNGQIKVVEG